MKTNQLRSLAAVGVLWLALGAGCHKDPPEPEPQSCNDGTCCMSDKAGYDFWFKVENEPADLVPDNLGTAIGAIVFKNEYPSIKDVPDAKYRERGALFCNLSVSKLQNLTLSADQQGPYSYKYRVWGVVYTLHTLTLTGRPITFIYVDRIEEVK